MTASNSLIWPMAVHVGLSAFLYVLLTVARAPAIWGLGRRPDGSNPFAKVEPRISANLSNQFEWPLFFHVACLLLMQHSAIGPIHLWLAWTFVAGRIAHSYVQILTTNVRLRGLVFTINFLAVMGMWVLLLFAQFELRNWSHSQPWAGLLAGPALLASSKAAAVQAGRATAQPQAQNPRLPARLKNADASACVCPAEPRSARCLRHSHPAYRPAARGRRDHRALRAGAGGGRGAAVAGQSGSADRR